MLFFSCLHLVTASLIFSKVQEEMINWDCNIDYSLNQVVIDKTRLSLEGSQMKVSGLSRSKYLFLFREGQLVFPNLEIDLNSSHEIPVQKGDLMIFKDFDGQRPGRSFRDRVFQRGQGHPIQPEDIETFHTIRLTIEDRGDLHWVSREGRKMTSFRRVGTLSVSILAFCLLMLTIYCILEPILRKPSMHDLCMNPENDVEFILGFRRNNGPSTVMGLVVDKDCNDLSFNMTKYADKAFDCFEKKFPNIVRSEWKLDVAINHPDVFQHVNSSDGCRFYFQKQ